MKMHKETEVQIVTNHGKCHTNKNGSISCPECFETVDIVKETSNGYSCRRCGCQFNIVMAQKPTALHKLINNIALFLTTVGFIAFFVFAIIASKTDSSFYALLAAISIIVCFISACIFGTIED